MEKKKKIIIAVIAVLVVGALVYSVFYRDAIRKKRATQIASDNSEISDSKKSGPLNLENVSPITGIECDNWNKRPVAVMQPADIQARPAAGFSEADMVIEMPAYTSSVTRLMGVYICNLPKDIGAIRSSRHDYVALAKGLDAVFIHWGGSHFALDLLKKGVIDNYDCMTGNYCARWEVSGKMRLEDTGHITKENVLAMIKDKGYKSEGNFSGYAHQEEASLEQRPSGGHLRVAFKKPYDASYDYDKTTNSYLRTWGDEVDVDKNNGARIAPKNIVVMFASSSQITTEQDYKGKGLSDPWEEVEEIKKTGAESISGRYNNVQIGDPWYDETDSGEAFYYFNGKEYRGTWKKDKSKLESKLMFYDENGEEIMFVPGQIWVEILEPGQVLRWEPAA